MLVVIIFLFFIFEIIIIIIFIFLTIKFIIPTQQFRFAHCCGPISILIFKYLKGPLPLETPLFFKYWVKHSLRSWLNSVKTTISHSLIVVKVVSSNVIYRCVPLRSPFIPKYNNSLRSHCVIRLLQPHNNQQISAHFVRPITAHFVRPYWIFSMFYTDFSYYFIFQ